MRAAVAGVLSAVLLAGCGGAERRPTAEVASGCGPGGALAFDVRPDGPIPTVDDTGRPLVVSGTGMTASVVDGALVPVSTGPTPGAFYLFTDLGEGSSGWGVRASWVWPTEEVDETGLGAIGLLLFSEPTVATGDGLVESRLHLALSARGRWELAVVADSTFRVVAEGTYGEPVLDGTTVYEATALIDPETGDVHLAFPDRTTAHVDAETIGLDVRDLDGRYAVVEAFQNLPTDVVPVVHSTEAYADPASAALRDCLSRVAREAP